MTIFIENIVLLFVSYSIAYYTVLLFDYYSIKKNLKLERRFSYRNFSSEEEFKCDRGRPNIWPVHFAPRVAPRVQEHLRAKSRSLSEELANAV